MPTYTISKELGMSTVDAAATEVNAEINASKAEAMGESLVTAAKEAVAKAQQTISKVAVTAVNSSEAVGEIAGSQLKIPYQIGKGFFKGIVKGINKSL
jgi:flavin-binding protein dodecin